MKFKDYLFVILYNTIALGMWGALAFVFDKWWLVLFSILFMVVPSFTRNYYRICDGCGKHSEYASTYNEALDKAKLAGWTHYVDGNRDYCPACMDKLEQEME